MRGPRRARPPGPAYPSPAAAPSTPTSRSRRRRSGRARRVARERVERGCPARRPASDRRSSATSSPFAAGRGRRPAARASGPRAASARPTYRQLPHRPLGAVEDRCGGRLGLVDRRHRLRLQPELLAATVELRRVHRAGRTSEIATSAPSCSSSTRAASKIRARRRLRGAVGRLERDPAVREGRVDVDERAAALLEERQRGRVRLRAPEEVDVQDADELLRLEPLDLGVDRHHRRRDERVDAAEALDRHRAEPLRSLARGRARP